MYGILKLNETQDHVETVLLIFYSITTPTPFKFFSNEIMGTSK